MSEPGAIVFYMHKGRWRVRMTGRTANARDWWNAIAHVKCLNHRLRMRAVHTQAPSTPKESP